MFTKFKIFIFSEDPDKLLPFYRDTLEMKVISELKLPRDYGYMLEAAPGYEIWLAEHSDVKGINKEPFRHIINLYSERIDEIFNKVKTLEGVRVLQEPMSMREFNPAVANRRVCTFTDPEGNTLQVMTP